MGIELDIARRNKTDEVVDLPSAIAATHIFRRIGAPGAELIDRMVGLGVRDEVKAHFDRLKAEPDFDQLHAFERIAKVHKAGGLLFLTGPAGSGKTEMILRYLKSTTALGIVVTASTNQARNVLRARGVANARTFHETFYGKPDFDPTHVAEIVDFIKSDGNFELSPAVDQKLAAAWRAATPGARERAAREVAGSVASEQMVAKALSMLGIGQGLMAVLKPMWHAGDAEGAASMVIVDEASMSSDADLGVAWSHANSVVVVGDLFQLPPVIDEVDKREGRRPALATIPLSNHVHLFHDRRVKGESQHLVAANQMLSERYGLNDLVSWARAKQFRGLTLVDSYDGRILMKAPALAYYRKTVKRIAVSYRQAIGLPEDSLVPGERLLIESVPRDLREACAEKGIGKNTRVVVLEQPSRWQVVVIAEPVFDALVAKGANAAVIRDHAIALALGVEYPAFELQEAGVRLTETMSLGGLALAKGQAVQASLAAASTVHKAQGTAFATAVVMMDDMFGYARSYGRDILDDLPIPLWRRVIYTALTRATGNVELVHEGTSQRTVGARLRNMPDEAEIRATLPETVRPDPHAAWLAELQELDSDATAVRPNTGNGQTSGLSWQAAGSNVTPLRPGAVRLQPQPPDTAELLLDPGLAAYAVTLLGKADRLMLPADDGSGTMLELGRAPTGGARMRMHPHNASPSGWETLAPGKPVWSIFHAFDLEMAETALRRFRDNPQNAFRGVVRCGVCGRNLEDPVSQALGIGPVCSARLGIRFEMPADELAPARKEVL